MLVPLRNCLINVLMFVEWWHFRGTCVWCMFCFRSLQECFGRILVCLVVIYSPQRFCCSLNTLNAFLGLLPDSPGVQQSAPTSDEAGIVAIVFFSTGALFSLIAGRLADLMRRSTLVSCCMLKLGLHSCRFSQWVGGWVWVG